MSSHPRPEPANAHPYAIKTTSTALLSRSNSTSSPHSSAHHYVPTSPSPTHTSPTKPHRPHRPSRHRYSRSLTGEGPRPLPAPPSPSPSPTRGLEEDEDTPRRRGGRADTLPSADSPFNAQKLELPDDPKAWTPAQVSEYLVSALHVGNGIAGGELPAPIVHDISKFVRDKKITGRSFLRLSEHDLEGYGINQLWRTTLLSASRSLRQNILSGRIWGFGNTTSVPQYEDPDDAGSLSSSSSHSGFSSNSAFKTRPRHSSTASEQSGRVRDMIDSLERTASSGSFDFDEDGSGSASESDLARRSGSVSPSKQTRGQHHQQRSLPTRGSVNDLFGAGGSGGTGVEREIEQKDSTITAHARRNVNGREARLLPFPPGVQSGGTTQQQQPYFGLTPSHTGSAYPLPPSPDRHHIASSRELGFKHSPPGSPHPQTYTTVVQHQHQHHPHPGGQRLLPYPPVRRDGELFHPRPRREVGMPFSEVGDVDTSTEGVSAEDESTGVSAYETALEGSSSQDTSMSEAAGVGLGEDEEEEMSVEQLLASSNNAGGGGGDRISGVDAWEMELGETVKRIGSSQFDDRRHDRSVRGGEVSEIGRRTGRRAKVGTGGTGTSGTRGGGGTRRAGVLGLFDVPAPAPSEEEERQSGAAAVNGKIPADTAAALEDESRKRLEHEKELEARKAELDTREAALDTRELRLSEAESRLLENSDQLVVQSTSLNERERGVHEREAGVEGRALGVVERESALKGRESALEDRESALEDRESALAERASALKESERRLAQKWLQQRAERLKERIELDKRSLLVAEAEREVERRMRGADELQQQVNESKEQKTAMKEKEQLGMTPVDVVRRWYAALVLPVIGHERTPTFLRTQSSSTTPLSSAISASTPASRTPSPGPRSSDLNPARPQPYLINSWKIRRDFFLGGLFGGVEGGRGGYVVLMSIGVCAVVLRVLMRRGVGVGLGIGGRR
ncbi:hypothetical protein B0H34DRAFT_811661 [Crassisporium funariophilum]|nr:hypothetical protein B0H34DRAFT_811661 [Crassisporium funariophilum]